MVADLGTSLAAIFDLFVGGVNGIEKLLTGNLGRNNILPETTGSEILVSQAGNKM